MAMWPTTRRFVSRMSMLFSAAQFTGHGYEEHSIHHIRHMSYMIPFRHSSSFDLLVLPASKAPDVVGGDYDEQNRQKGHEAECDKR